MPLPKDLVKVNLNEADKPVLAFTVTEEERTLEQRVLGALIRAAQPSGRLHLHLVRTRASAEEKPIYDYEIRAAAADRLP